jgi:hypothetical protein
MKALYALVRRGRVGASGHHWFRKVANVKKKGDNPLSLEQQKEIKTQDQKVCSVPQCNDEAVQGSGHSNRCMLLRAVSPEHCMVPCSPSDLKHQDTRAISVLAALAHQVPSRSGPLSNFWPALSPCPNLIQGQRLASNWTRMQLLETTTRTNDTCNNPSPTRDAEPRLLTVKCRRTDSRCERRPRAIATYTDHAPSRTRSAIDRLEHGNCSPRAGTGLHSPCPVVLLRMATLQANAVHRLHTIK